MLHWYSTAMSLDSLYKLEQKKTKLYGQITGVQTSSITTLQTIYDNKVAIDRAIEEEKNAELKSLRKMNTGLRIKNTCLTITTLGFGLGAMYIAVVK